MLSYLVLQFTGRSINNRTGVSSCEMKRNAKYISSTSLSLGLMNEKNIEEKRLTYYFKRLMLNTVELSRAEGTKENHQQGDIILMYCQILRTSLKEICRDL